MSRFVIVEGNNNDKDNVRAIMVKGEKGAKGDNGEITYSDVVDNLTSSSSQLPLSANQGNVLKGLIDKNLKWFKVTTSNTQAEIQTYMNTEGAKVIEFANGTYNFSSSFRLNANTEIILNNSTLNFSVNHGFYNFLSTDTFFEYNGNGNIKIMNGKIVGGGFSFCHAKNIIFKNIYFLNCLNDHILEMASINNLVVDSCIFEGIATQSEERQYVEYIQIDNMTRENFPWFDSSENQTYDDTPNKNWKIINNEFKEPSTNGYDFYTAIGTHTSTTDVFHKNIIIKNNNINNYKFSAIRIINIDNCTIENNTISNSLENETTKIAIRGNNNNKNISIINNILDGGNTAIQNFAININFKIINNIIKNFLSESGNSGIIGLSRPVEALIYNNDFINCSKKAFNILSGSSFTDGLTGSLTIQNNTIDASSSLTSTLMTINYNGTVNITNNSFNNNVSDILNYYFVLGELITDCCIANNSYNNSRNTNIIDLNGYTGSLSKIKDIQFKAYSGDAQITQDTSLAYNYTQFNKAIVTVGATTSTETVVLYPWAQNRYLDARTYSFVAFASSSSTALKCALKFNSDNTFLFTCDNTAIHIRNINLLNE